jgi:hypothetical protein
MPKQPDIPDSPDLFKLFSSTDAAIEYASHFPQPSLTALAIAVANLESGEFGFASELLYAIQELPDPIPDGLAYAILNLKP